MRHNRHDHTVAITAAIAFSTALPVRALCSLTPRGASAPNNVTALCGWNGSHGLPSSFSPITYENLPGLPSVDISISAGAAPPRLGRINWNAPPAGPFGAGPFLKTFPVE